jgi:hypothetical protein
MDFFFEQVRILSGLIKLAEHQQAYAEALERKGFTSFQVWNTFVCSYCLDKELETHRVYLIEEAKTWIGSPDGFPLHIVGKERGYKSPILVAMRAARDAVNGRPYDEITGPDIWMREIDPCLRRLKQLEFAQDPTALTRREQMYEEFREVRCEEVKPFRGNTAPASNYSPLAKELFCVRLAPYGFKFDAYRSRQFSPVVSKPLNDAWDLCWSPDDEIPLRLELKVPSTLGERGTTLFCPMFYVSSKQSRGEPSKANRSGKLNFLMVAHDRVVPGFRWAYSSFEDGDELDLVISAHATMYGLIADFVESRLAKSLSNATP